jgi:hypothetical protein
MFISVCFLSEEISGDRSVAHKLTIYFGSKFVRLNGRFRYFSIFFIILLLQAVLLLSSKEVKWL